MQEPTKHPSLTTFLGIELAPEHWISEEGLHLDSPPENYLTVIQNLAQNNASRALALSVVLLKKHPSPQAYLAVAQLCLQLGHIDSLRITLKTAFEELALDEVNYQANLRLATLAFNAACMDLAIELFQKLALAHPQNSHAQMNLAFVFKEAGRYKDSEKIYRDVLKTQAADHSIRWNFSHLLLLTGQYQEGLEQYEARWWARGFPSLRRDFQQATWWGEKNKNLRLLIHAEQGFGDTIQAARYLHLAQERVGSLIIEIQKPLLNLFKDSSHALQLNSEKVTWVEQGQTLPEFDQHLPIMSLPKALGLINFSKPPCPTAYLAATASLNRVKDHTQLQPMFVGLVWKGRPTHPHDERRSFKLTQLTHLLELPGIRFFSLQQRVTPEEKQILDKYRVVDLEPHLNSFTETAQLIQGLDLMICTDTALAHLSAALGKPTWIGVAACPDWRWGAAGSKTPWYSSVQLWRQDSQQRSWEPVFEAMNDALLKYTADWLVENA